MCDCVGVTDISALSDTELQVLLRQTTQAANSLARTDINAFVGRVLRNEKTGRRIVQAPTHRRFQAVLDAYPQCVLWGHTELGKTQQMVGRILATLGEDTNKRITVVGRTAGQAVKILLSAARYNQASDDLRAIYPNLLPGMPWRENSITVKRTSFAKEPSVYATGVHGAILGSRIDVLILDDVVDFENSRTQHGRDDLYDWVMNTLMGRLTDGATVWCSGNAYHPDDLMHRLEKLPGWHGHRFPVMDAYGVPHWPEQWPTERIAQRRSTLGPLEFARQMMCQARSDEDGHFRIADIDKCALRGRGIPPATSVAEWHVDIGQPEKARVRFYTGVDLAVQTHSAADKTAIFTIGVWPDHSREIVNVQLGRWQAREVINRIVATQKAWNSLVTIENNACFPPGTPVMTLDGPIPIEEITPGTSVLTHLGQWRKVTATGQRHHVGELVDVRPSGGLPILATPEHPLLVWESGRVKCQPVTAEYGKHRPIGDPKWVLAGEVRDGPNRIAHYTYSPTAKWPYAQPVLQVSHRGVVRDISVGLREGVALGLYLAEGHTTKGQVWFSLHSDEDHLVELVGDVAREWLGANFAVRHIQGRGIRVIVGSTALAQVLLVAGKSHTKCLPWRWQGWPLDVRLAIVRGWLLGDGSLCWNNANTDYPVLLLRGATISYAWARWVTTVLQEAGLRPTIKCARGLRAPCWLNGRPVIPHHKMHTVALCAEDTDALIAMATTQAERTHWACRGWAGKQTTRSANSASVVTPGGVQSKVLRVGRTSYDGAVHNLSVEVDESYVVDGVAVHNCQDMLRQFTLEEGLATIPFTTGRNRSSLEFQASALAAEVAQGMWIIPSMDGPQYSHEIADWVEALLYYNPSTHTPDVMAASLFARFSAARGDYTMKDAPAKALGNREYQRRGCYG